MFVKCLCTWRQTALVAQLVEGLPYLRVRDLITWLDIPKSLKQVGQHNCETFGNWCKCHRSSEITI